MTKFHRILLFVFLLIISQQFVFAGQEVPSKSEIEQILQERVDKYQQTVGIVVGIVDKEGSEIYSYGKFRNDTNRRPDGDTLFEIGSITKVFTSILLADMAENGEVNLDDPIAKYLPEYVKVPVRNDKEITFENLATHTSALPRLPSNLKIANMDNPYADYTVEQMYEFLSGYSLTRDIGKEYEYSNFGAGLLGHTLSLINGTDYETLVTTRICKPLKMDSTVITFSDELKKRLAAGHNMGLEEVSNWDIPTMAGAGAIRSTANDMLKFVAANLGLKKSNLLPVMHKTHMARVDTTVPDMKIGLAWHIFHSHDKKILWHNGGTGGYRSFTGFDPERRIGVVVLSNSSNDIDDIGMHLLDPEAPLKKLSPPRKEVAISTEVFKDYTGEYELAPEVISTISIKDDKLFAQPTGQPVFRLYPESESKFFIKEADAQVSFVRNSEGEVTHLILHQMGVDQKMEKRKVPGVSLNKRKEITLTPEILEKYAGEYELAPGAVFTITTKDDNLFARLTGQNTIQIYPEAENRFFYKVVNAQIHFNLNDAGEAESLTLFQNGREVPAKKVK